MLASALVLFAPSTGTLVSAGSISAKERRIGLVEPEATLIAASKHSGVACGILFTHQVARYRVDRLVSGRFVDSEIVVDHPACDGDVFKTLTPGSRVRLSVRVV